MSRPLSFPVTVTSAPKPELPVPPCVLPVEPEVSESWDTVPAISVSPVASLLMMACWPTATLLISSSSMVMDTFKSSVFWMTANAVLEVPPPAAEPTVAFSVVMVPDAPSVMVQSAICSSSSSISSLVPAFSRFSAAVSMFSLACRRVSVAVS